MFKTGDLVRLNALGKSKRALGNKGYVGNPCSDLLLAGEVLEVSKVLMQPGGRGYSLLFFGSAYSFSADFFEHITP